MGTWNVTAAYDKAQYAPGDTITITISGNYTSDAGETTTSFQATPGATLTDPATGKTKTLKGKPRTVDVSESTAGGVETVVISSISDPASRIWTIASDGLSARTVA